MPAAEVDVTSTLVRALLTEQHPDLADLDLVEFANGWDNVMFRLGDQLAVRVPRRGLAAPLVEHEQAVLPVLAARLPIAIPAPVRLGRPSAPLGYPWAWSVIPWQPGSIAAERPVEDPSREAVRLGGFLSALHVPAPADAPENPFRGHFIGDNEQVFADRIRQLVTEGASSTIDPERARARWRALVDGVEAWALPPVWIHGDLHLANVLVDDGPSGAEIVAVIDWGDVCAGDPATDLSVAWSLFDEDERGAFRDAAGTVRVIDDDTWRRAEAWALHFAVVYLLHSADNPTMTSIGERLARALGVARGA